MKQIIESYVLPGSIVNTDCWKSYIKPLRDAGIEHKTVNHTLYFKDPVTQVHTNTIEGLNNGLKTLIKPRHCCVDKISTHLSMFIWRRKHKKDIWTGFLDALRKIKN